MLEDFLKDFLENDEEAANLPCMPFCALRLHMLSKTPGGVNVQKDIRERCIAIGQYIADTGATVRSAAQHFGVSKSSVHKDMKQRLPQLNRTLAMQVRAVLSYNKAVRHLRGGAATRRKYRARADERAFPHPNADLRNKKQEFSRPRRILPDEAAKTALLCVPQSKEARQR